MTVGKIIGTRTSNDGEIEVELVSPNPEEEMRKAAEDFVRCERRFREFNECPGAATNPGWRGVLWWGEAECLMLADKILKDAFCGRDTSPASIKSYHEFRLALIFGKRLRWNA